MSIINSTPLSERLLCLLKSETSFHDCLVLKCRDEKERRAHRTVLIATSSHFSEILREEPARESVDVPYTSDVVDIVIEYMYSSDTIHFKKHQAIQLFSAASFFALENLSHQIETFFRFSMDEAMQDEEFLANDTSEDVKAMKEVFKTSRCDKLRLVSRILGWEKSKRASPDFILELLDSVVNSIPEISLPSGGAGAPAAQSSGIEQANLATQAISSSLRAPKFVFSAPTATKTSDAGFAFSFGSSAGINTAFGGSFSNEKSPFSSSSK